MPLAALYFVARLVTQRGYSPHFLERLGLLPRLFSRTNPRSIWLHAVSLGEVTSALPLIEQLRRHHPLAPIYLSTSTIAGRRAAEREAEPLVAGIFYSPLDYAACVRRVLKTIRPALLIVLETEIWPNLYAETKQTGASLAIVNGRISDRTLPRYLRFNSWIAPLLHLPDIIFVQSAADYDRYRQLGAPISNLHVEANLKYDAAAIRAPLELKTFGAEHVWIAASTVGPNERGSLERHSIDEDEIVIEAFRALAAHLPRLLLILAPRQPARFDLVAANLEHTGVSFVRRTQTNSRRPPLLKLPGVLLLDTIGELARIYSYADAVFVGGSIAPRGGHNIVEPAAAGAPIVVGPHMQNFQSIMRDFREAQAILQIEHQEDLAAAIRGLMLDRDRAKEIGQRASRLVQEKCGVASRLAMSLSPLYQSANLKPARGHISRALLSPLAFAWTQGGAAQRLRAQRKARSRSPLPAPVISIGGITVGGSGKTPFTTYLAKRLVARGIAPAILTRGYRRRSPATLVVAPGAKVPTAMTGDEAQIFLRNGLAPVGIGANRYETARLLLHNFPSTRVLLLDDGFQHASLERDLDIVLIDGLDPFGQDAVVPLGRLREPPSALRRADILVVTRAEDDVRFEAISSQLRRYNPGAPIFRTRLLAHHWRDHNGALFTDFAARRVAAFCGLGNPENFWRTLESLGLRIAFRWAFPDHHTYQVFELQRVARQAEMTGAELLVTTEKDRINCPNHLEAAIAPLQLAWLEIELGLENEAAFFAHVEQTLSRRAVA